MKAFGTIFTVGAFIIAIGVMWYVGQSSVSMHVVPSLSEYIASSTQGRSASSTQSAAVWMASSTIVQALLSDHISTSTESLELSPPAPAMIADPKLPPRIPSTLPQGYVTTPKGKLRVMIAKTPSTRERGLGGYTSLAADQGMLFIFPTVSSVNFWMKDMNFSIDTVWIDKNKKIIGVTKNISPQSFPKTFPSPSEIQFVIEVNAGGAEKFGLARGTTVVF